MHFKILIAIIYSFVIVISTQSQNLITNPSFEDTICDPIGWMNPYYTSSLNWYNPNDASPDLYGAIDVETNCFDNIYDPDFINNGIWQYPYEGLFMAGLICGNGSDDTRDFIQSKLLEPLEEDSLYCFSMRVSLFNDCEWNTNKIGAYFSPDSVFDFNHHSWFQFESNFVSWVENPNDNFLDDTLNWMLVSGSFNAVGGEKFITIGNNRNNSQSQFISTGMNGWNTATYYVDSLNLTKCSVSTNFETTESKLQLYPNPISVSLIVDYPNEFFWKIYDLLGKRVLEGNGINRTLINCQFLKSGNYFISVSNNRTNVVKKILKL